MNHIEELCQRIIEIHKKKREDYTANPDANPFENFDRSAEIATWFPDEYKGFAVLIGTKLARLGALLTSNRTPNNESLDDTFLDLATYCTLMYAYWKRDNAKLYDKQAIEAKYTTCIHKYVRADQKCVSCSNYVSTDYTQYDRLLDGSFRLK